MLLGCCSPQARACVTGYCLIWRPARAGSGTGDWKRYSARHPATLKRRVRKGIPDRLRGVAWQLLSGGRELLLQNEGPTGNAPSVQLTKDA